MYQFLLNHKSILLVVLLLSSYCEGTSITLSPLGVVSVCPGGQVLLTCERTPGSFLHWNVSVPHMTTPETIVPSQGDFHPRDIRLNGFHSAAFTITRTSVNPLTSQMKVNDVTTEINGSVIYCSERGNENGAPMATINVTNRDSFLNISLVNNFFRNGIQITLQWPREPGAVYDVNVLPDTQVINVMSHNSIMINLTISYNIQYELNVSITSKLCVATTARVLKYVSCDPPEQLLLHRHVTVHVDTGSQNYPLMEGQYITYTCPLGLVLTGPNASECMENGEWEPDPREAHCIANCRVPPVDRNVALNYNSTLEGSVLTLTCVENDTIAYDEVFNVMCHSSGKWIPDAAQFTCSSLNFTSVPSGTDSEILIHSIPHSSEESADLGVILGSVLGIIIIGASSIIIAISAILCLVKKGFLPPKKVNSNIQVDNIYHPYIENSSEQQDTLVYADIGPSSVKKRAKHVVTLRPDDVDDRVEYARLNHSLPKPIIATNQDSIADDSLNLDTLLIQIREAVTSRWYQLGKALGVDKDVLDRCSNYPPEESIVEILDHWLRNYPGRPTWRDVANALRKINLQQLANDIEMVYETGKLPIQVEDDDAQQVFTTTAFELPQPEEETSRMSNYNSSQNLDKLAPPLPPKPLAGSDVLKEVLAPPRPPKYVPK